MTSPAEEVALFTDGGRLLLLFVVEADEEVWGLPLSNLEAGRFNGATDFACC